MPRSAAVAAALLVAAGCHGKAATPGPSPDAAAPTTSTHVVVDPDGLPGIRTGPPPWAPELDHLRARLDAVHIPALAQEGNAMDLHVLLAVSVDGQPVQVPPSIGLNGQEVAGGRMATGFVSPLHTHDGSGLVHVHSPTVRLFTLGDLFDVWGVRLTDSCLGGSCASGDRRVRVLVDGEAVSSRFRAVPLRNQARIAVGYGTEDQTRP